MPLPNAEECRRCADEVNASGDASLQEEIAAEIVNARNDGGYSILFKGPLSSAVASALMAEGFLLALVVNEGEIWTQIAW